MNSRHCYLPSNEVVGEVSSPVAVRHAWENAPEGNLFNLARLPASPFRMDID